MYYFIWLQDHYLHRDVQMAEWDDSWTEMGHIYMQLTINPVTLDDEETLHLSKLIKVLHQQSIELQDLFGAFF